MRVPCAEPTGMVSLSLGIPRFRDCCVGTLPTSRNDITSRCVLISQKQFNHNMISQNQFNHNMISQISVCCLRSKAHKSYMPTFTDNFITRQESLLSFVGCDFASQRFCVFEITALFGTLSLLS